MEHIEMRNTVNTAPSTIAPTTNKLTPEERAVAQRHEFEIITEFQSGKMPPERKALADEVLGIGWLEAASNKNTPLPLAERYSILLGIGDVDDAMEMCGTQHTTSYSSSEEDLVEFEDGSIYDEHDGQVYRNKAVYLADISAAVEVGTDADDKGIITVTGIVTQTTDALAPYDMPLTLTDIKLAGTDQPYLLGTSDWRETDEAEGLVAYTTELAALVGKRVVLKVVPERFTQQWMTMHGNKFNVDVRYLASPIVVAAAEAAPVTQTVDDDDDFDNTLPEPVFSDDDSTLVTAPMTYDDIDHMQQWLTRWSRVDSPMGLMAGAARKSIAGMLAYLEELTELTV